MAEEKIRIVITGDSSSVKKAFGEVDKSVKTTEDKFRRAAQTMTSLGTKLSIAVTAPLVLIGKKSLDMAMDVVESENLFEVSLGKMADAARDWSRAFSESVGLNEYEVRKQVGTFDVMLKSMGLTEEAAYDMSKSMTELAYDMASFYNLRPEEAFDKLKSGIVGMPRPLQDLGIVVNETAVQMYALKQGIIEEGEVMTESQKIMARYGAIMERTSDAQGDMARTLESPANQMRIFKEQVNLAMIELGKSLIPVMQKFIDMVKPWVEKFKDLNDEQKKWITILGLIAAGIGPALLLIGSMTKAVLTLRTAFASLSTTAKGAIGTGGWIAATIVASYLLNKYFIGLTDTLRETNTWWSRLSKTAIENTFIIAGAKSRFDELKIAIRAKNELSKEEIATIRDQSRYYDEFITNLEKALGVIGKRGLDNTMIGATIALSNTMEDYADMTTEAKIATVDNESAIKSLMEQYGLTREEAEKYAEAQGLLKEEIEETTEAVDDLRSAFNDLMDTLFDAIDATNNLQESEIGLREAKEEVNKLLKEGKEGTDEYIKSENELDDAYKDTLEDLYQVYTSLLTTNEEKENAKKRAMELAEEYVNLGRIGADQFAQLAMKFGFSADEIMDKARVMGIKLDDAFRARTITARLEAPGLSAKVSSIISQLDRIPRSITTGWSTGTSLEQSGGLMKANTFSSDLNIPLYKGEAVLPAGLVRAIKEGRGSFAGVEGKGGTGIINNFNISELIVREEADLKRIADQLYDMQQVRGRLT
ncbi:MAG: hypothetical protein PVJ67_04270 [Candidatus Pacearchaeota archaeon]|jgi:hypothetical protein